MNAPSRWWPVPHEPYDWFSGSELKKSRLYHQPVRRAAGLRLLGQVVLGSSLLVFLGRLDAGSPWLSRAALAVGGLALAWWIPAALVDVWFEFRHEPRFGSTTLPPKHFAVGSLVTLALALSVAALAAALVYGAMALAGQRWWLLVGFMIVSTSTLLTAWGPGLAMLGLDSASDRDVDADLEEFAAQLWLGHGPSGSVSFSDSVSFAVLDKSSNSRYGGLSEVNGLNAATVGFGHNTVVLSADLAAAEPGIRRHVVAHELSHVFRGDLLTTVVATVAIETLLLVSVGAILARWGDTAASWVSSEGRISDPRFLPLIVAAAGLGGALGRPPLAWLSRSQERRADIDAHDWAPSDSDAHDWAPSDSDAHDWAPSVSMAELRRLHVTDNIDLEPSRLMRILAFHPSPGERLELAARCQLRLGQ